METQNLDVWVRGLSEPDRQVMLLRAAKDYRPAFSNPDEIGMGWAKILREHGYGNLAPYVRSYLAHQYLIQHELSGIHNRDRKIPVF